MKDYVTSGLDLHHMKKLISCFSFIKGFKANMKNSVPVTKSAQVTYLLRKD